MPIQYPRMGYLLPLDGHSLTRMTDNPRYLTITEVADRFRVSEQTVHRWIDTGVLPAIQIGRIKRVPFAAVRELETEAS